MSAIQDYLEDYYIDLGQIWQFEVIEFLKGNRSDVHMANLKSRYEELIIQAYLNQSVGVSLSTESNRIIEPVVVLKSPDEQISTYDRRIIDSFKSCRSLTQFIKLELFAWNNNYFTHHQVIYISPELIDFEFWFSLKIRQYEYGFKFLDSMLKFNLNFLFGGETSNYLGKLSYVLLQYSDSTFSPSLIFCLKKWISEIESRVKRRKQKKVSWNCEVFLCPSDLRIKSKGTPNIDLAYSTFLIEGYRKDQTIFDTSNLRFVSLIEIFNEFHNEFFTESTIYSQFINLFKSGEISPENKVTWIGSYFELYTFVKAIEESNLCTHLNGSAKWKIATMCFNIRKNRQPRKGETIPILSIEKISEASGKDTHRTDKLIKLIDSFKRIIETNPK